MLGLTSRTKSRVRARLLQDYLKGKTHEATDKTKDSLDPDTGKGTGSRGNQESASDLLNRYTDKAKSEVEPCTKLMLSSMLVMIMLLRWPCTAGGRGKIRPWQVCPADV